MVSSMSSGIVFFGLVAVAVGLDGDDLAAVRGPHGLGLYGARRLGWGGSVRPPAAEPEQALHPPVRRPSMQAILRDRRNDEHVLIAGLHVAFLLFHNKIVENLRAAFPRLARRRRQYRRRPQPLPQQQALGSRKRVRAAVSSWHRGGLDVLCMACTSPVSGWQ
jgi:hypothetical protein